MVKALKNTKVKLSIMMLLGIMVSFILVPTAQAQITVQVDRTDIALGESFKLVFVSDAEVDDDPDFSPLEVFFRIVGTAKSSNVSIINGTVTRKQTWALTLRPKQVGKITVPAISFGKDKSPPSLLTIKRTSNAPSVSKNKNIFIKAEVDDNNVVIGQQIILKVKIYTRLNISSAQLSDPLTSGFENVHAQLGASTQFSTNIGGVNYTVLQQNYVITPKTAGKGFILPITLQAETGSSSSRFFDPFGRSKVVKISSKPISVTVLPEPKQPHKVWIPASDLTINSQIDNGPYKVGEPINLTLTIKAKKQVAELLPILPLAKQDGVKSYSDKPIFENSPTPTGINGTLIQKFAIIPQKEGEIVLPEYQIKWWNTQTEQFETAKTPSRTLKILPSDIVTDAPQTNDPLVTSENQPSVQSNQSGGVIWQLLTVVFLSLWLITLWFLYKKPKADKPKTVIKTYQPSVNSCKRTLIKACQESDAKQTQQALIAWANAQFPNLHITNIQQVKEQVGEAFKIEIDALQQALYSPDQFDWNGLKMAKELKAFKHNEKAKKSASTLRELYPE